MNSCVLLTQLSAHFIGPLFNKASICSDDISIPEYLAGSRDYKNFKLSWCVIKNDNGFIVPRCHFVNYGKDLKSRAAGYSPIESRYIIEIKNQTLAPARLVDALDGVCAFVLGRTDRGITAIPLSSPDGFIGEEIQESKFIELLSSSLSLHPEEAKHSHHMNGVGYETIGDLLVWRLVDDIVSYPDMIYALLFFREALFSCEDVDQLEFFTNPEPTEKPISISESVKLENALHNFYKVIECLYGGTLPSKNKKVCKKFSKFQIDLNEQSIKEGKTLIDDIRHLEKARNDRAAHGRVHDNRVGTYKEIHEYRQLVHTLLKKYFQHHFNTDPFDLSTIELDSLVED